jgi:hypothetical protein
MADDLPALIDPQDRQYVRQIADPAERDVVVASLLRHRVPERLAAGDPIPSVEVVDAASGRSVRVDELVAGRPAVLVFGSYT